MDIMSICLLHRLNSEYRKANPKIVTIDKLAKKRSKIDDYHRCLQYLIQSGYVTAKYSPDHSVCMGYSPTHKGSHWLQFFTIGSIEFWCNSVIVPILVSVLTQWVLSLIL